MRKLPILVVVFCCGLLVASSSAHSLDIQPGEFLVSELIGTRVHSKDGPKGVILDVLVTPEGKLEGYAVGIGGFLGIGMKVVAVSPNAMSLTATMDPSGKRVIQAQTSLTTKEYKEMPHIKYNK